MRRSDRLVSETGAAFIRVAEVVEMDSPSARNGIASRSEDAVLPCLFFFCFFIIPPCRRVFFNAHSVGSSREDGALLLQEMLNYWRRVCVRVREVSKSENMNL